MGNAILIREKPSAIQAQCKHGLRRAFELINPGVSLDDKGYVGCAQDNLLPGILIDDIQSEFGAGAGGELKGKMRAVHSSSALAVNTFAPVRSSALAVSLAGEHLLRPTGFEVKMPTGVVGRIPPHLDVVATSEAAIVAIESKCTEYMCVKKPRFSDEYEKQIVDRRRDGLWFAEMMRIKRSAAHGYRFLDAAQLIKHAFGVSRLADGRRTTLLYLFWEPRDAAALPLFAQHRSEIADFAARVAGDDLVFAAMTYADLWKAWLARDSPKLRAHANRLRARYWVPARAWKGAGFDGDATAGFHEMHQAPAI